MTLQLGQGSLKVIESGTIRYSTYDFIVVLYSEYASIYYRLIIIIITRMVQLPATAAIEYVADCCITRTRTITKTVLGPYVRSPQVQYVYAPSGLSVPSVVA